MVEKKGQQIVTKEQQSDVVSRRGKRYDRNPFIGTAVGNTKQGIKRLPSKDGTRMMVVNELNGEYVAPAGFWQGEEIDRTQFVKLYVNGIKALVGLTGSGTKVFEVLYRRVQENIGKDTLWMTYPSLNQLETPMGETTFYRGMKELLEKGFVAESLTPGFYYLNMDYMWNGDRLAFVKEYRVKPNGRPKVYQVDDKTGDLFGGVSGSNAPK